MKLAIYEDVDFNAKTGIRPKCSKLTLYIARRIFIKLRILTIQPQLLALTALIVKAPIRNNTWAMFCCDGGRNPPCAHPGTALCPAV